ncbi:MAG TPA: D-aminoacyl-tRNA deacylase [Kiritimatiellia bacterium]|nr:D-aminoacyl-tRNA deacylase [Kiritimatiellia bacterium]
MRLVVQRVRSASVTVDGVERSRIGPGLLVLCGVGHGDTEAEAEWLARKTAGLRIFSDEEGKMNLSLGEVAGGAALVVSQFTLYGDCRKGNRPSFIDAAPPEEGRAGYQGYVEALRRLGVPVQTGEFAADMKVALVNDGPVTLILERTRGGAPA